jgi:hypothetical protein
MNGKNLLENKALAVRRTQLLFFILVQQHVSVIFDYRRAISRIKLVKTFT